MKRKKKLGIIIDLIIIVCLLVGSGFLLYPTVCDLISVTKNKKEIDSYTAAVEALSSEELQKIKDDAAAYNSSHTSNTVTDAFSEDSEATEEYENLLDPCSNGMMGYIDIPKIDVHLAIYHGTGAEVLSKGVGHLEGSSLPVGGTGTHAVLAGHRGLPEARLFSDLDQIEEGDTFTLTILDETLTYEVDQIVTVLPDETEYLNIDPSEDYVTLVTCTPYGINTHRLLIRGKRAADTSAEAEVTKNNWSVYLTGRNIAGLGLIVIVVIILVQMSRKGHKKHEARNQ